ncbi:MAG: PDZ domain-containing protein [Blastocatellales bacterium]
MRILVVSFWILTLLPPASAQTSRRKAQKPGAIKTPASGAAKVPADETEGIKITLRQSEPKGWVWVSHTIDLAQQLGGEDSLMTLDGEPLPVMQRKRVTLGLVIDNEHVVTRLVDVTPGNPPINASVLALGSRPVAAKFLGMDTVTGLCVLKAEGAAFTPPVFSDLPALPKQLNIRLYGFHPNLNQSASAAISMVTPRRNTYQGQIAKAVEDFRFNTGNPIYYLLAPQLTPVQDCSLILNKDDSVFGIALYNIGSEGKHLVYPISRVQTIAQSVIKDNRSIAYGWLGANGRDVYNPIRPLQDKPQPPAELGVRIMVIAPDSPAEKAGVKPQDIVVAVNDRKVDTQAQMVTLMRQIPADSEVTLRVKRGKEYKTLKAKLVPAPSTEPEQQLIAFASRLQGIENELRMLPATDPSRAHLEIRKDAWRRFVDGITKQAPPYIRLNILYGFEIQTLTGQLMSYFAVTNGVLVSNVTENDKAARSGLRAGDVIIEAGGKPVNSIADLIGVLDSTNSPAEITISRRREHLKITFQR